MEARECPSASYLVVADINNDAVQRFDGETGAFVDTFVPKHSGGMNQPWGLLFGPDGNGDGRRDLYVSTGQFGGPGQPKAVLRYDGTTGAFIDVFTKGGDLASPRGIILGPDGDLFVADRRHIGKGWALESRIARFDGATGEYLGDFVPTGGGGLQVAEQLVFGPSVEDPDRLDLYAVSLGNDSVKRYHGESGAYLGDFIPTGGGGLEGPVTMTFTPGGDVLVADFYSGDRAVKRFRGPAGPVPGAFVGAFVPAGSGGLRAPSGMVYGPDGNGDGRPDLYLADQTANGFIKSGVKRYDGVTGAYIDDFIPERSGNLEGAVMIAFTETDPVTLAYTGAAGYGASGGGGPGGAAPAGGTASPTSATVLASGLEGAQGSTVGPGNDLYVAEGAAGRIARVDTRTGAVTTFASGLPVGPFGGFGGGVTDVAFVGRTTYALVTGVGPDVGGTDVVGLYRIDGPTSYTVIADIGTWSALHPPLTDYELPTGVQYSLVPYRGGFLVADGHHNRVLYVELDGDITEVLAFGNTVPTGLEVRGDTVYVAEAGPTPHRPEDGAVSALRRRSAAPTRIASGAPLLVDVEFGPGNTLYALSQGTWDGILPGDPALPDTGSLVRVNPDGTFTIIEAGLDRPTSLEFVGTTAYVVTMAGEVLRVDDVRW